MFSSRFVICFVYFAQLVLDAPFVAPEKVIGIFMTDVTLECREKAFCVGDLAWKTNGKRMKECNDEYCLKEDGDFLNLEVRDLSLDQINNRYRCNCQVKSGLRATVKYVTIRGQCQALTSVNGNPMIYNGSYPKVPDEMHTVALMEGDSFDMQCLQDGAVLSHECPWTSGNHSVVTMDLDQCTHTCILDLGRGKECIVEVLTLVRAECHVQTSVNGNPMMYNGSYPRVQDETHIVAVTEGDNFGMQCLRNGAVLSHECPWTSENHSVVTMDLDQCTHTCILDLGRGKECIVEVLTLVSASTTLPPLTTAAASSTESPTTSLEVATPTSATIPSSTPEQQPLTTGSKTTQGESLNLIIPTTSLEVATPASATIPSSTPEQQPLTTGSKTTQGESLNLTIPTTFSEVATLVSATIPPSTSEQLPPTTGSKTTQGESLHHTIPTTLLEVATPESATKLPPTREQLPLTTISTTTKQQSGLPVPVRTNDLDHLTEDHASLADSTTVWSSFLPEIIFVFGSTFIILFLLLITIIWRLCLIYVKTVDGKEPDVYSPKSFYGKPKTSALATSYQTLPRDGGRIEDVSSPATSTETWRTPTRVASPATSTDAWYTPTITVEEDRHPSASSVHGKKKAPINPSWSADNWRKPTSSVKKRYESMVREEDLDRDPSRSTDDWRMGKIENGRNHFNVAVVVDNTSMTTLL